LADKIKSLIRMNGPISVTDYFALCLADPEHGYYRTREPFGRHGDFITDLHGACLAAAWSAHRRAAR
jgi:SAM-dependent MidA family methyltransferase